MILTHAMRKLINLKRPNFNFDHQNGQFELLNAGEVRDVLKSLESLKGLIPDVDKLLAKYQFILFEKKPVLSSSQKGDFEKSFSNTYDLIDQIILFNSNFVGEEEIEPEDFNYLLSFKIPGNVILKPKNIHQITSLIYQGVSKAFSHLFGEDLVFSGFDKGSDYINLKVKPGNHCDFFVDSYKFAFEYYNLVRPYYINAIQMNEKQVILEKVNELADIFCNRFTGELRNKYNISSEDEPGVKVLVKSLGKLMMIGCNINLHVLDHNDIHGVELSDQLKTLSRKLTSAQSDLQKDDKEYLLAHDFEEEGTRIVNLDQSFEEDSDFHEIAEIEAS